jgi:hypothetical protein
MNQQPLRTSHLLAFILLTLFGAGLGAWALHQADRDLEFLRHGRAADATVLQIWTEIDPTSAGTQNRKCLRYEYPDTTGQRHEGIEAWSAGTRDERNQLRVGDRTTVWYLEAAPDTTYFGAPDQDLRGGLVFGAVFGVGMMAVGLYGLWQLLHPPQPRQVLLVNSFDSRIVWHPPSGTDS